MTATRWQRARQITQIASVILFFLLAFLTYRGAESLVPLDLYLRVNPLVAFAAMMATRAFIATMALAMVALALGFVVGRAWCGWLCPLGALLDWTTPKTWKVSTLRAFQVSPNIKFILLLVIFFAALMGNLTFLILDPITILNRTFSGAALPALNALILGIETLLTPIAPLAPIVDFIEQNFRGTVLPAQQTTYGLGILFALVFVGIVALNWVASRFWCRYLCPLGAVYALQAKISWLRPRAVKECSHCAACMKACPTGAITVTKQGFTVDSAECVACMDCVSACPESVIGFRPPTADRRPQISGGQPSAVGGRALSRRQFIASAATAVTSVALFRAAPSAQRDDAFLVRPPGARENHFLEKCIRCAECVKVCPTGGLQPSLFEAGIEGFWTPLLVSRLGYCDFSCNACGQICPTGAIPPLALDAKRATVIGHAYIDENRCIPWASYNRCVVCEEMCPVPEKAIRLDEVDVIAPDGARVHLQRPRVIHTLCIGCGICEYQCPLVGPAAIRVYAPTVFPSRA
ncbi:MAG: 4Fe-4S dicluster domain-containing protein [Chloroflexi bacterium]|nr:4Fe-4S dicluster domain-containing protein [Chloroflexota bacterium]